MSLHTKKAFEKLQPLFMVKTLKLGIEEMYINPTKTKWQIQNLYMGRS